MSINVTTIPVVQVQRSRVVVEMSWEDAEALAAMSYGLAGPYAVKHFSDADDSNHIESLSVKIYSATSVDERPVYTRPATDMRDRLRSIGNAIRAKLNLGY